MASAGKNTPNNHESEKDRPKALSGAENRYTETVPGHDDGEWALVGAGLAGIGNRARIRGLLSAVLLGLSTSR